MTKLSKLANLLGAQEEVSGTMYMGLVKARRRTPTPRQALATYVAATAKYVNNPFRNTRLKTYLGSEVSLTDICSFCGGPDHENCSFRVGR